MGTRKRANHGHLKTHRVGRSRFPILLRVALYQTHEGVFRRNYLPDQETRKENEQEECVLLMAHHLPSYADKLR